jgi:hypothetical protein
MGQESDVTDYYSTMTANEWVACSRQDFDDLNEALQKERQRIIEEDDVDLCLQVEYSSKEGVFIFSEQYFGDDDLTDNVCLAIGKFLSSAGHDYLEFSYSQTASRIIARSHGGGCFRIYSDGRIDWPKLVW